MFFPELAKLSAGHEHESEVSDGVRQMAFESNVNALRYWRYMLASLVHDLGTTPQAQLVHTTLSPVLGERMQQRKENFNAKVSFFQGLVNQAERAKTDRTVEDPRVYTMRQIRWTKDRITMEREKLMRQGGVMIGNDQITWPGSELPVSYDRDAATRERTRLHFARGLIFTDKACTTLFDTRAMVTQFGGPGWAIYVMSPTGSIHASNHSVGLRHHSSLLAGADVAGAGEMKVMQGKLVHITSKSGHYLPNWTLLVQVLHRLNRKHVDLNMTKVTQMTAAGAHDFPSVGAFLRDKNGSGNIEFDGDLSILTALLRLNLPEVIQPALAAEGWRPGTASDNWMGAVVIATGERVPHRLAVKGLRRRLGLVDIPGRPQMRSEFVSVAGYGPGYPGSTPSPPVATPAGAGRVAIADGAERVTFPTTASAYSAYRMHALPGRPVTVYV